MQVQESITAALSEAFAPEFIRVENESHMHNVPPGSESHFKVTLVCARFEGQRKVRRHQAVYEVVNEWLSGPVHALALHTYSPAEWEAGASAPDSPNCLGGSGQ